jgi:hypothetical protein
LDSGDATLDGADDVEASPPDDADDATSLDAATCGAVGLPCCSGQACGAQLYCSDGGCAATLGTGGACSSAAECASGICTPVGNGAGCTGSDQCAGGLCCLTVNAGGKVTGACELDTLCSPFQLCSGGYIIDCNSYGGGWSCQPFLNGTGACTDEPLGDAGDGGLFGPDFPSSVCSTTCTTTRDCVAGWICGPAVGQSSDVCQCSATLEICNGIDDDCNGTIDDPGPSDLWCKRYKGPGYSCQSGRCTCALGCDGGDSSDASADDAPAASDGAGGSSSDGPGSSSEGGSAYDPSVYQHHKNGSRDGLYVDPTLTPSAAATMHALGFMGTVTTSVYAQPLYVARGPAGTEALIVVTEDNHVTAFNAGSGDVIWDQGPATFGQPVTGGLPCGTIRPLGITGTPFIDPASPINGGDGVIYFDAMTTPDQNATAKHLIYAVKLADGTVLPNWPVDVGATVGGFTSAWQNQRGALQLVNGVLYVPYGGLNGDCPDTPPTYYGWVVGVPVSNPQSASAWHTAAYKGGIWAPGALPTDGTSIFPITGNTADASTWGGGEAVLRLAATASGPTFSGKTIDYFAPDDWAGLDLSDLDLGGASEVLFDMPGAFRPHLVAAGGKDSNFYLLDRDNLGGIGGQLLKQSVIANKLMGAPAAYTTKVGTYVVFHVEPFELAPPCPGRAGPSTASLIAVQVASRTTGFTARVAWCVGDDTLLGSPIVTTTDGTSDAIVWDANDALWGYDGDTGQKLYTGTRTTMSTRMQTWNTPIALGRGRIAIAVDGQLYVFSPDVRVDAGATDGGGPDQ